jgi:hypothetical protein
VSGGAFRRMKQIPPHPSPLKAYIGLENGKPKIFVSAFKMPPIQPRHWRDSEPPKLNERDPIKTLQEFEKYYDAP